MASSPTLRPEQDRVGERATRSILNSPSACPGSSSALLQPRDAGPLPAGLDVQDGHGGRGARLGQSTRPTRSSTTPATAPSTASRSRTRSTQNGAGAVRQRRPASRPTSTRSTPSSATSAMKLGAETVLDKAKDFGFYSKPPIELPSNEVAASGALRLREARAVSTTPRLRRPGPPRVRPGQAARDAAPDGARRRRGREQRRRSCSRICVKQVTQPRRQRRSSRSSRTVWKHAMKPATAAALNQMMQAVVTGGHRHRRRRSRGSRSPARRARPRRASRNVYDAWFIFFAPGRQPAGRRRRRRRAPAERLRRRRSPRRSPSS